VGNVKTEGRGRGTRENVDGDRPTGEYENLPPFHPPLIGNLQPSSASKKQV